MDARGFAIDPRCQHVADALAPIIGRTMADLLLSTACKDLGLVHGVVLESRVQGLVDELARRIHMFITDELARARCVDELVRLTGVKVSPVVAAGPGRSSLAGTPTLPRLRTDSLPPRPRPEGPPPARAELPPVQARLASPPPRAQSPQVWPASPPAPTLPGDPQPGAHRERSPARAAPEKPYDVLHALLSRHTSDQMARNVVRASALQAGVNMEALDARDRPRFQGEIERRVRLLIKDVAAQIACLRDVREVFEDWCTGDGRPAGLVSLAVASEEDVLTVRGIARKMCGRIGFSETEQIKVATVVSELTRNIVMYAGSGTMTLHALAEGRPGIRIVAEDQGPGIENLDEILAGRHRSREGLGLGLMGSKRLMDLFDIRSSKGKGTRVEVVRYRS